MDKERQQILVLPTLITQQCECCEYWVNQEKLIWDLEEERLVCRVCYLARIEAKNEVKG